MPAQTLITHATTKQSCVKLNYDENKAQDKCNSIVNMSPDLLIQRTVWISVIVFVIRTNL